MSTVVSGIDGRVTTLEGHIYKRKIYTGTFNLSYNSGSLLKASVNIGFNGYVWFIVLEKSGTPYAQVAILGVDGGPQIWNLYARGSGFVSGHTLQVLCLGIET
jgi:hypothetical protein